MIYFKFINTQEQLQQAAEEWSKEKELAIDLECENNLHHYGAYISLIQISSRDKNWIVDVLTLKEITLLLEVLENKNILKVFHDIGFDFRIINTQFSCRPKNIFDTQLAAVFLGKETIGLGSLLREYFSIGQEKKFQMVDWTIRPIPKEMLEYAVMDTLYLLPLKDTLEQELKEKNRLNWVKEELAYQETLDLKYEEQSYLDLSGVRSLSPSERAIVHVLFTERKKFAEKLDKPVFKIFSNKQLLAFAKNPPRDWNIVRGVHPIVKRNAEALSEKVREASTQEEELPLKKKERLTTAQYQQMKEIIQLRNNIAEEIGIKGHLFLNNEQMKEIVKSKSINSLRNWQKKLLKDKDLIMQIIM